MTFYQPHDYIGDEVYINPETGPRWDYELSSWSPDSTMNLPQPGLVGPGRRFGDRHRESWLDVDQFPIRGKGLKVTIHSGVRLW